MIGRALMLPISLLPAAGLLLAFGDKFHLPLMMNAGGVIFDNLPMLFAIGSAVGLAAESGIAALSAAVSVFIINVTIGTVMHITPEMAAAGGKYAMVVGIPTLQMGVFGGLISGILAAWCYNKFHTMQLPEFLGFFSGKRFVAIATAFLSFLLGMMLPWVWSYIQSGIDSLSVIVNGDNQALSTFIFGLVERALIPLGLHHIWYPSFWYSFGEYTTSAGQVIHGDQTIWFKMLEEGVKSFSSDSYQNAGKFMQGRLARNIMMSMENKMATFSLGKHPHVELCDLLKLEGWCESGAQAKAVIAEGLVKVDGEVETRKRCKIVAGQTVVFETLSITVEA